MQPRAILAAIAAAAVLASCAVGNQTVRNMTTASVSQSVVAGKSTLPDVKAQFGDPSNHYKDADGTDVYQFDWEFSRPSAKNFIPLNVVDEFMHTKKTLSVWVNPEGFVTKHELSGVFWIHRRPLIGADSNHSMRPLTQEELDGLVEPQAADGNAEEGKRRE
jgi:hypothetical protein